ncbi:ribonuclease P protein subunit p38-like [Corticium candelabrum]|uniref:ribonuclease P protein subunit p38-like n=1 Tax=Corticium candelabrum TaxID=121492 RepID=UPI002E25E876|nr:ribonuclease P protein subunit p38-like [Corticium candelabrum]XP_062521726.1 ribonuclease P protein subunit p38-like [Corticium candelabrum]
MAKSVFGRKAGALRQKPSVTVKTMLESPFQPTWPHISSDVEEEILGRLVSCFQSLPPYPSNKKNSKKVEQDVSIVVPTWRRDIVVGINEVTRSLERDELMLVIVDKSVRPVLLLEHLVPLASHRRCYAVALNRLGEMIGRLLAVKRVSALGFKKSDKVKGEFDDVMAYIKSTTTPDLPQTPNSDTQTALSLPHKDTTEPSNTKQTSTTTPQEQSSSQEEMETLTHDTHAQSVPSLPQTITSESRKRHLEQGVSSRVDIPYVKAKIKRVESASDTKPSSSRILSLNKL